MRIFNRKNETGKIDEEVIVAPVDGAVLPIEQTPDSLFANKAMGDGVMIKPKNGNVYSPCNGVVEALFPTKHAIGIRMENGSALFIHFGLETAKLKGRGFDLFVKKGTNIKKGKLLMEVDLEYIRKNADNDCIIMAISELQENKQMKFTYGEHFSGDAIITLV